MVNVEQIITEQIRAGDRIALSGRTDEDGFFTIRSIRDGMRTGIGFRTTEGEYVKLPFGYTVNREVRS